MTNVSPFQPQWQWRPFLICHLIVILLAALWLCPPTRTLLDNFDIGLFNTLNGSLALDETWLVLWGLLSTRPFDAIIGILLLALMIRRDWLIPGAQARRALFGFIVTLLVLLIIRVLYTRLVQLMGWQHVSLSELLDNAIHLSDHFPYWEETWEIKDRSSRSFPGDHASVLWLWGFFVSLFARAMRQRIVIWSLAVFFMMPRLVAGAHWGQDDYIGGLQIALLAMAWSYHTPLMARSSQWLLTVTQPLFARLARWPIIGRLNIVCHP